MAVLDLMVFRSWNRTGSWTRLVCGARAGGTASAGVDFFVPLEQEGRLSGL